MAKKTGPAVEAEARTISVERMGKVQTWNMSAAPYKGKPEHRAAYRAGFAIRTQQFNQGDFSAGCPDRFASEALQAALFDGYSDAATQDAPTTVVVPKVRRKSKGKR